MWAVSRFSEHLSFRGLPRRLAASRCVFALLVGIHLGIGTFCLVDALSWIGEPFPGYLVNERMVVNGMGRYGWTGTQRGLRYPDKILSANAEPVSGRLDLGRVVHGVPIGTLVVYEILRDGQIIKIPVPTMRFSVWDLTVVAGLLSLLGLVYLLIGAVVFVLKPDTLVSWSFSLLAFAVSMYSFTAFDVAATHRGFVRAYLFALALGPAAGLHLSMLFPRPWQLCRRLPWIQLLPYVVAAALIVPVEWYYPEPDFLPFYRLQFFYLIAASAVFVGASLYAFRRPSSAIDRQRSKVVLFGAALAFPILAVGELTMFSGTTLFGFQVQANFLAVPFTLFPASIAYAITRHNLFDVDVYIKRTLGYVLMTTVVGLTYFTLQTATNSLLSRSFSAEQAASVYPLLFALVVVFFFNPVNRKVQEGIETLFFRKAYDYKETLATISSALSSLVDLDGFLEQVFRKLRAELFVDRVGVILVDSRQQDCRATFLGEDPESAVTSHYAPDVAYDDPLLRLLASERRLMSRYDIDEDPRFAGVREACGARFAALGASLVFPLVTEGEFAGLLVMGGKKSGHFYAREDVDLLGTVATMISTAIESAHERGQRNALMQLFSKHVSPEVAESLWEQREQFLDGGRPRSQMITATLLFTDLAGFSGVSERLDPETLMDWLNAYMEAITRVVMDHGGVVDDYFGDGVKVNFGVPVPRTSEEEIRQDAVHAVDCALTLEGAMLELNASMQQRGLPTIRLRVGIHTGRVLAGSLGSAERMKYTTLGDNVNTAARLESYDKSLDLPRLRDRPARILISDATLQQLGDRYETQRVGELELRGKQERVMVHCVLARQPALGAAELA